MPRRDSLFSKGMIAVGLLLLIAIIYWPTHSYPFVDFDDPRCVSENAHVVSGLTSGNIRWAFTAFWAGHWAPLAWISYQCDATLFHLNPGVMHLENVALHALSTLLLFALLNVCTGAVWRSALVAAIFAVHPLHVESVAWITERRDMLSGPPLLLALLCYARYTRAANWRDAFKWYLLVLVLFVISLLGKAMAVTLPVTLLLFDLWPLGRLVFSSDGLLPHPREGTRWTRLLLEKVPLVMIALAVSWAAFAAQMDVGAAATLNAQPLSARIGNALVCYVAYLGKFIWPIHLGVFYPLVSWSLAIVLGSLLTLLLLSAWILWWRQPFAIFGWFWFLIVLLPVIGFFQSGPQAMADRYMYLPVIGLSILAVWGLALLRFKRQLSVIAVLAMVLMTAGAREQVACWSSSRALFVHALSVLNQGADLHSQLARLDLKEGNRAGALSEYLEAARLDPTDYATEYDLGNLLLDQPKLAIPHYLRALELNPHFALAENNMAISQIRAGDIDLAIRYFHDAITDDPGFAEPHANLGMLMLQRDRKNLAAGEFGAALRIDPNNTTARTGMAKISAADSAKQ